MLTYYTRSKPALFHKVSYLTNKRRVGVIYFVGNYPLDKVVAFDNHAYTNHLASYIHRDNANFIVFVNFYAKSHFNKQIIFDEFRLADFGAQNNLLNSYKYIFVKIINTIITTRME